MSPKKPKLGQNFLIDPQARQAIVAALGDTTSRTVLEIGPGHGAITELLAARCRRLLLVELDPGLAAELRFRYRNSSHVDVIEADILRLDLAQTLPPDDTTDVIGNLPYYITSDILLKLFAAARAGLLRRAVLMMQREVADRVAASPGVSRLRPPLRNRAAQRPHRQPLHSSPRCLLAPARCPLNGRPLRVCPALR